MASHKTALITDSACDLPPDLIQQYDVRVVPLYLIWGQEQLRDRVDIQPVEFYNRLVTDPVQPTTSQPTPQDFAEAIREAMRGGAEEAVVITISGAMSSTINSAQQALEMLGDQFPVHIVDSKANSMSQGWQVLAAARARAAGGGAEDMIVAAGRVRKNLVTRLYLDTIEYMYRGGRIGAAAHWVGSLLNLKPLLSVNHETGSVEPEGRTRTRTKGIEGIYQSFFKQLSGHRTLRVAVLHGNVPEVVKEVAERIWREYSPVELLTEMTSPVMGVHTGPGALALCGYYED